MRDATTEEVNLIANDPDVYNMMMLGMLHPQCALDFSDAVEAPKTVALIDGGFCALFVWTSPGTYEVHVMALKGVRGALGMAIGRDMLAEMKRRGAERVWGQPSAYNRAAQTFVRRMGLRYQDTGYHPVAGDVLYFEMEL